MRSRGREPWARGRPPYTLEKDHFTQGMKMGGRAGGWAGTVYILCGAVRCSQAMGSIGTAEGLEWMSEGDRAMDGVQRGGSGGY